MQKITPHLWFDKSAEEAITFYVDVFNGAPGKESESKVLSMTRYPGGITEGPMAGMEGKVLTGVFELAGQRFMGLDGGPVFKFNEAVSLLVDCKTQEEIDYFWSKLSAHPENEQCGWCKDKFGLSWQITPGDLMGKLMTDPDPKKSQAVINAFMPMKKLDMQALQNAYDQA
ncbi:MAG: 3-demethylubiquinone-9 3-methyltransferase [Candidatus Adlerbacteria bacterium]|nr:3-demethylubiquinone-9 3-methyltransferase [Candidatus Adlerbacteria bacterium]